MSLCAMMPAAGAGEGGDGGPGRAGAGAAAAGARGPRAADGVGSWGRGRPCQGDPASASSRCEALNPWRSTSDPTLGAAMRGTNRGRCTRPLFCSWRSSGPSIALRPSATSAPRRSTSRRPRGSSRTRSRGWRGRWKPGTAPWRAPCRRGGMEAADDAIAQVHGPLCGCLCLR